MHILILFCHKLDIKQRKVKTLPAKNFSLNQKKKIVPGIRQDPPYSTCLQLDGPMGFQSEAELFTMSNASKCAKSNDNPFIRSGHFFWRSKVIAVEAFCYNSIWPWSWKSGSPQYSSTHRLLKTLCLNEPYFTTKDLEVQYQRCGQVFL